MRRLVAACWLGVLLGIGALRPLQAADDTPNTGQKWALLVGLSRYRQPTINQLPGTLRDVRTVRELLTREYGFPEANITLLADERATRQDIQAALTALARSTHPGDTVVFYFTGHGVQLPEERQRDRARALVPFDVVYDPARGRVDNSVKGDELANLFDALPANQVVIILDCCHATSGIKGIGAATGVRSLPPVVNTKDLPTPAEVTTPALAPTLLKPRQGQRRALLCACAAAQEAQEVRHGRLQPRSDRLDFDPDEVTAGAFTFFLLEGLRGRADTNGDGQVSYTEAIRYARERLDAVVNEGQDDELQRQTPQLAVSDTTLGDLPVFGVTDRRPFFARLTSTRGGTATLDRGAMHGLQPDQALGLFATPPDRQALTRPLGRLEVERVGIDQATARLASGGPLNKDLVAVPLVNAPANPDVAIQVVTAAGTEESVAKVVRSRLAEEAHVRVKEEGFDLRLSLSTEKVEAGGLELSVVAVEANGRKHGPRRWPVPARLTSTEAAKVGGEVVDWVRPLLQEVRGRQTLAALTNPAPGFGLQAVVDHRPGQGSNLAEYRVGEGLKFGLKATADCFYYILVIDPNGREMLWCPRSDEQHFAPAGKKLLHPGPGETLPLKGPPGVYVVKLLAVRSELPASALNEGRPRPEFFGTLAPADWTEASVSFRLLPR